jgi:two-component system KDP operon response regulator KdpE
LKTLHGKILIVDDEPALRRALFVALTVVGFEIVEASTGEQALALFDVDRCDVVLVDIDMPGMGGIEACRELRRRDARLQIIMFSVREGEEERAKAFDAGANDYIAKPFTLPQLLAHISTGVRRSKAERTEILAPLSGPG